MATNAQVKAFLDMVIPIAQRQAKKHGGKIYASVCIAQAAHESGWGTSKKMVKANALYGIKVGKSAAKFGTAWGGKAYKTGTTEYYDGKNATKITDWFRSYGSVEDACEDYFDMLCTCSRYKGALNQPSAQKCIEGIIKGGYATGPDYVSHIVAIINKYNLAQYDGEGAQSASPAPSAGSVSNKDEVDYTMIKVLKTGTAGKAVRVWQTIVDVKADGVFGQQTYNATVEYQKAHGLKADGIVGAKTWKMALENV